MNAADVLHANGAEFRSIVFIGQSGEFATLGNSHQAIEHPRAIRQNFSFYEGEELVAHVRSPFSACLGEMRAVLDTVRKSVSENDIVLFAGALPDLNFADRAGLVAEMARLPGRLVLDISTLTVDELQAIAPNTVKLNASEFRSLLRVEGDRALVHADLERVHRISGAVVIVTQGAGDILAIDRTSQHLTFSIATDFISKAKSVVGSGDAFLAGYVSGLSDGLTLCDSIMRGIIFGTARQQANSLEQVDFSSEALQPFSDAPVLREQI